MVCIGGTCSASSFSVWLLFHLTAKIKAYNQILLIGPDCGSQPRVSLLSCTLCDAMLRTAQRIAMSPVPISQDSGCLQSIFPTDSKLVIILACWQLDLAISSAALWSSLLLNTRLTNEFFFTFFKSLAVALFAVAFNFFFVVYIKSLLLFLSTIHNWISCS